MIRPVGDSGFLIEVEAVTDAHRIWAALQEAAIEGVRESVVGARSVLVHVDPAGCDEAALHRIAGSTGQLAPPRKHTVDLPVTYDGADLADVAAATGLSIDAVIERHSQATYTVAFLGFSPGFAYLIGLDPALVLPRRDTPRTQVPAGSLAIAGEHTAVYPQQTPGGWHLLGHSETAVFDPDRDPPALLAPGDTVTFSVA